MINYLVSYDDQDCRLGEYFADSEKDLRSFLDGNEYLRKNYEKIHSRIANEAYMDLILPKYNSTPFVFVAYTHGDSDAILCQGAKVVNTHNSCQFSNSLFYSTACLTGRVLGHDLINKGCLVFVGYCEPSIAFLQGEYRRLSIECDNFALKLWLSSDIEIDEAVSGMRSHYNEIIDELYENNEDPLYMGALVANREALICIGDISIKREYFYITD